jgi:methylmalonyl-CoA mutase N-terminal domain/subunit
VSLTAQQPENNIVRTAIEALAAVLGGTQSLHTNAMDEVFALPTERNAEIALRTQQIIAEETGVASTIDPLGGSWFVEEMTDRIEAKAEDIFAAIDRMGGGSMLDGVLTAINDGWFQSAIADSAYAYEKALNTGERVVVGVNKYVTEDEGALDILRIGADVEATHRDSLRRLRGGRDQERTDATLQALREGAAGDANLMELIIEAARAGATLGEIVRAMKDVFGGYREQARV